MAAQLARQLRLRSDMVEIGNMEQLLRLLLDRFDDRRIAMAQAVDRDAGEKIEILFAVGIPDLAAPPLDQRDRRARVGLRHVLVGQRCDLPVVHFRTTSVPTPSLVKISSNTACFTRPSMIWVFSTPPLSALMQHSTFGIMPDPTTPS